MPCGSGMSISNYDPDARRTAEKAVAELDKVTRVACTLMKVFDSYGVDFSAFDPEVALWWDEHKKVDEERLRKEALSKLTIEERASLGL